MFPQGPVELVNYFYTDCNDRLVERLKKEAESHSKEEYVYLFFASVGSTLYSMTLM